jgi:hypothetical protein
MLDLGALKVLVEARKSGGMVVSLLELEGLEVKERIGGPIEKSFELDPGLDELEVERMGLLELKKPESRFRTAGEEGIFCNVSIVLSDNDGRDLLPNGWALKICSPRVPSSCVPSSPSSCGRTSSCSRRTGFEDFLNRALLLDFLIGRLEGWTIVLLGTSWSRGLEATMARDDRFVVELDNGSRDGALRKRGLFILLSLGGC